MKKFLNSLVQKLYGPSYFIVKSTNVTKSKLKKCRLCKTKANYCFRGFAKGSPVYHSCKNRPFLKKVK